MREEIFCNSTMVGDSRSLQARNSAVVGYLPMKRNVFQTSVQNMQVAANQRCRRHLWEERPKRLGELVHAPGDGRRVCGLGR
jgi:hypothetical protein